MWFKECLNRLYIGGKEMKPAWLMIAEKEEAKKIHEFPGPSKDNPEIMKYYKATTYPATHDEVPWCSAFVNWCMDQSGIRGTKSAAAVSWLEWGRDCGDTPEEGCIVVFEWESGGHHVAFYDSGVDEDTIKCLGGNQHDSVCYADFPVGSVMSYRMPK